MLNKIPLPKIVANFKGKSGCRIELLEKDGALRVRKIANEEMVIERLRTQYDKMKLLQQIGSVSVPKLYGVSENDGSFFYDMEYCERTRNFADAAEEMSLYGLRDMADFLIRLLEDLERIPALEKQTCFETVNKNKLKSLLEEESIQEEKEVFDYLEKLLKSQKQYFSSIADMTSHFCHGDLTMDNLLCDDQGRKWLIDPIDCFFEHPWCDIAKLYQDIEGEWHQIRYRVHQRRASSNLWRLGTLLKSWVREKHPLYPKYHYYFLGLNFARILPYAVEDNLRRVVKEKTRLFLEKFIKGELL